MMQLCVITGFDTYQSTASHIFIWLSYLVIVSYDIYFDAYF